MIIKKIFFTFSLLLITLVTIIIYSNTLNSPFLFDDIPNIKEKPSIRITNLRYSTLKNAAFTPPSSARPLPNLTFALNYYIDRYDVTGYHIVNIIIHILNGILVYLLAMSILTMLSRNRKTPLPLQEISLCAALIFAAHPLQTQSVTYIVQRMNTMAALFYLLSILLYHMARRTDIRWRQWALFGGVTLSAILALGSKQIAATLPFTLLLYEWYFLQDMDTKWVKKAIPSFIIALGLLFLFTLIYVGKSPLESIVSNYQGRDFTLAERLLTQFRVMIFYISLLFFPHPSRLNLIHHINTSQSLMSPPTTILSLIALIGLLILSVFWARNRRLLSFCILWFFITMAIESSVIGLEMIYEHRLYLPMVGFAVSISYLLFHTLSTRRIAAVVISSVIVLCLGYGTYVRNTTWKDGVTLWRDVIKKNPMSYRGYNNLGLILMEQGHLTEAINHYSEALRVKPNDILARNNLGNAFMRQGFTEKAMEYYYEALRINPRYAKAHNNLGLALASQGRLQKAIDHYSKAISIDEGYVAAYNNAGIALARKKYIKSAKYYLLEALKLDPEYGDAHYNLGLVLYSEGRLKEAVNHFSKALKINPKDADAHYNLGKALEKQGKIKDAKQYYYNALQLKPDFSKAHIRLGALFSRQGRFKEAISHFYMSIEKNPGFEGAAYFNIACLYARQNSIDKSIDFLKKAVEAGFDDWKIIKTHSDLQNIRSSPLYKELIKDR